MSLLDSINKAAEKTKRSTQQHASATVASSDNSQEHKALPTRVITTASFVLAVALGGYFGLINTNQQPSAADQHLLTVSQNPQSSESGNRPPASAHDSHVSDGTPRPAVSMSHSQGDVDSRQGVEQCDLMIAEGKLRPASHCLLGYLKKNPADAQQHYKLALILGQMGMTKDRQKALENAYAIDSANETFLLALADIYFDTKQYFKLHKLLNDALAQQQDLSSSALAKILALAGKARMDIQADDDACKLLSKSVALNPNADNAYALGVCNEIVGYEKGAILAYQQALDLARAGGADYGSFQIDDLEKHLKHLKKRAK